MLLYKQCKTGSSTGENDAIKRCNEHKRYEAAAGVTWHTVLQQTSFLEVESVHSKITVNRIV